MVKRILTLYVEDGIIELAKAKGLNLSQFVEDAFKNYLDISEFIPKGIDIKAELKAEILKKTTELTTLKNEITAIEMDEDIKRKERDKDVIKVIKFD